MSHADTVLTMDSTIAEPAAKTLPVLTNTLAKPAKSKPKPINWDHVTELRLAGLTWPQIAVETGHNANTLQVGFSTKGLSRKVTALSYAATLKGQNRPAALEQQSRQARAALADEVLKQTSTLQDTIIPGYSQLTTCDGKQGRADVVKKIADTAATVFGWDAEDRPALVAVGLVGNWDAAQDAIDVASATTESVPGQITQDSTGAEATSG